MVHPAPSNVPNPTSTLGQLTRSVATSETPRAIYESMLVDSSDSNCGGGMPAHDRVNEYPLISRRARRPESLISLVQVSVLYSRPQLQHPHSVLGRVYRAT